MRCYNGAPDSELQALLDSREAMRRRLAKHAARPVYFPMEGCWQVYTTDNRPVAAMYDDFDVACTAALAMLGARP